MYKKVLIISDNQFLSEKFYEIVQSLNLCDTTFHFSISPFSKRENFSFLNINDISVFNLKNNFDIDFIINNYELIFSIHCKQLFPIKLIQHIKCINVHPGYNPINRGWYPQVFSILNDLPVGATIHEIDEKLDHGPIIAREFVKKESFDTSLSLYNRIINKELDLLKKYTLDILNNNYEVVIPEIEGNLFLKKDFNNLLELNLDETASLKQLINKLRALTHGNFNNAYFVDNDSGKKIFVNIVLTPEVG